MFSPHVGYNGWTNGLGPGEICYLRHWRKEGNPDADRSKLMTGDNVLNGIALTTIDDVLGECDFEGTYFWYRQMYNSTHDIVPQGCKKISSNGYYLTEIRDSNTLQRVLDIEKKVRDYIFSHQYADRFLVADTGAAGIHNENNYPGGCPFSADLLVEYFEKCVDIWGANRVCANIGGESAQAKPVLERAGQLGIQCIRQDNWGRVNSDGENRASMYDQRIGYIGYTPNIINLETNGGGNAWPSKNINIKDHFDDAVKDAFQIMFHSNMGSRCNYAEFPSFVNTINTYAWPKFDNWLASFGNTPPVEPPDPTDKMKFNIKLENGFIELIQTVPTEDPNWLDAFGKNEYTFESEHHAKITIDADDTIPISFPFMGWEFPIREVGSTPADGTTQSFHTYFRTEGRDTEVLDAEAVFDGYPPETEDCCEDYEERLTAIDESIFLLHQAVVELDERLQKIEDYLLQGSLVKELV